MCEGNTSKTNKSDNIHLNFILTNFVAASRREPPSAADALSQTLQADRYGASVSTMFA